MNHIIGNNEIPFLIIYFLFLKFSCAFRYFIEVSTYGEQWDMVADRRHTFQKGHVMHVFPARFVRHIRIVGTDNSHQKDTEFAIVHFECGFFDMDTSSKRL